MPTGKRRIRPVDDLIVPAVDETLRALDPKPEDAALVRLVQRYAATIDEAAVIAAEAADIDPEDEGTAKALRALQRRVEASVVLAEIGPKLHAALAELGASPKARAGLSGKGGAPSGDGDGKSKLEQLRARRARSSRAAAVDTSPA